MAFPSMSRKSGDADFLNAFTPEDFAEQVHKERGKEVGFLFRVDHKPGGRVVVLIQSAVSPDWEYAFQNAGCLLAAPPEVKRYDLRFTNGQSLRFRLVANPTNKLKKTNPTALDGREDIPGKLKRNKLTTRVPLFDEGDQALWLERKFFESAKLIKVCVESKNPVSFQKRDKKADKTLHCKITTVTFSGVLKVTDASKLSNLAAKGVGPAKAFGCGLLSLARA
jgi:CRISPR system Cascade subunit CasE